MAYMLLCLASLLPNEQKCSAENSICIGLYNGTRPQVVTREPCVSFIVYFVRSIEGLHSAQ